MSLTKVSNTMISSAPVSVLDFMTQAEITAVQTGVYGSVTPAQITAAIQASLDSLPQVGASWVLPAGNYHVNDTIIFPNSTVTEIFNAELIFQGTLKAIDYTKDVLFFNNIFESKITGIRITSDANNSSWSNNNAAVRFDRSLANTTVSIDSILGGFHYGLVFFPTGNGACAWDTFYLGRIRGMKYGVHITSNIYGAANYFNANTFFGGDFNNPYFTPSDGSWGIYIRGTAYANRFYSPNFAYLNGCMYLQNCQATMIDGPYFDTQQVGQIALDLRGASNTIYTHLYDQFDTLTILQDSAGRCNTFLNTGNYSTTASNIIIDERGMDFHSNASGLNSQFSYNAANTYSLVFTNHLGTTQIFDKQFEATSSAPTSGTYAKGAIAWNVNTVATGQTMGYMCSVGGTSGTLSGVTGGASIGTATLVVNDATNIKYGMIISVAGAFTGVEVLGVSGTTITLSGSASATVVGAAVSYYAPSWVAMPNFA